jgi:hypothetical protein
MSIGGASSHQQIWNYDCMNPRPIYRIWPMRPIMNATRQSQNHGKNEQM